MSAIVRSVTANVFAVLADCHIHPGGGPAFSDHVLAALADAEMIVTLGDMGESVALDQLEAIAPLFAIRGQDDPDDPRILGDTLLLDVGGVAFGCVFDATAAGLATASDPFTPVADFAEKARALFGRDIDVLLHASTHKFATDGLDGGKLALNPGSAILPAEGRSPSFARLVRDGARFEPQIVLLG